MRQTAQEQSGACLELVERADNSREGRINCTFSVHDNYYIDQNSYVNRRFHRFSRIFSIFSILLFCLLHSVLYCVGRLRMYKPDKAKSCRNTVRDRIHPRASTTELNPGHAGQHPSCHAKQNPQARVSHVPTEYPPLWHTQKQPECSNCRPISRQV